MLKTTPLFAVKSKISVHVEHNINSGNLRFSIWSTLVCSTSPIQVETWCSCTCTYKNQNFWVRKHELVSESKILNELKIHMSTRICLECVEPPVCQFQQDIIIWIILYILYTSIRIFLYKIGIPATLHTKLTVFFPFLAVQPLWK